MKISELCKTAITASIEAGKEIMKVYNSETLDVEAKSDDSPLTQADLNSNAKIIEYLKATDIPVISEEIKNIDYSERKDWSECWIIDPMDGTKEFVNRNGEFTVNIALLKKDKLEIGIIYAPVLKTLYFTDSNTDISFKCFVDWEVSFNVEDDLSQSLPLAPIHDVKRLRVVASKSHLNQDTKDYIDTLANADDRELETVSVGSSLKFCLVAEGNAEVYPRFGPTMEWDTAAGQAICEAAGIQVTSIEFGLPLRYNKEDLYNPYFLVRE
jgi:3'(2'), 5'-bisphosphate nucleotidase